MARRPPQAAAPLGRYAAGSEHRAGAGAGEGSMCKWPADVQVFL